MTAPPLRFLTPRLELVAATAVTARADASDRPRFAVLLEATVPPTWPPSVMADVLEFFARKHEEDPDASGWWNWYALERASRTLIGGGGFTGAPNDAGIVTMGYSIAAGYESKGYACELAGGLTQWAAETGRVRRVVATTFERHFASIRVLEKNGFVCRGVSSEDAAVRDEDRQGRGALMVYVREIAP
jgi:RimJ/RimL family protein N-acetyltransferase